MYIPSNKYIKASKKISRNPKSKIIIDDVEYTGRDIIKTYPSFSHDAQKMIGEFPTKECKFVIFNRENNIDVVNKDIKVYRGLLLDDNTIEYIPQGIFHASPDGIKTNSTAKTIELTIKDKSTEFDSLYDGIESITYPATIGEFIDEIVTRRGFVLETPEFPFFDFVLKERPNFNINTITERMLIAAAATLGGCNAQMSRTGGLKISKPYSTGLTIKKINYKSLISKEKMFGPINVVSLGKKGINDDIQFRDEENIKLHGECEWKILDNPFIDLIRQETVDKIAANIIGMTIIPFELKDSIDSYLYDINDSIIIEDKFGNLFETTILNVNSSSRIYTNLKSDVQVSGNTNKNLAGSSKVELENIKFDVDHVKKEMKLTVEKVDANTEQLVSVTANVGGIQNQVTEVSVSVSDVNNKLNEEVNNLNTQIINNTTLINQTKDNVITTIKKTGGNNKIRNSVGFKGIEFIILSDDAVVTTSQDSDTEKTTTSGSKWIITKGKIRFDFTVLIGSDYTICFKYKKISQGSVGTSNVTLNRSDIDFDTMLSATEEKTSWTSVSYHYTATISNPYIIFDCDDDKFEISDFIVCEGEEQPWSQYFDEVYGKTHTLDGTGLGLKNTSNNKNSKLNDVNLIFQDGSTIKAELSENRVFSNTGEFTESNKIGKLTILAIDDNNIIEF